MDTTDAEEIETFESDVHELLADFPTAPARFNPSTRGSLALERYALVQVYDRGICHTAHCTMSLPSACVTAIEQIVADHNQGVSRSAS